MRESGLLMRFSAPSASRQRTARTGPNQFRSAAAVKIFRRGQPFRAWGVFLIVSDPARSIHPPAGPSPYEPKWARDPFARRPSQLRPVGQAEDDAGGAVESIGSILARAGDPLRPERTLSVNPFLERSLQPDPVPYPWPSKPRARFHILDIISGSIVGVSAALFVAFFLMGKSPVGSIEASDRTGAASFAARFAPMESLPERRL
jgi:hypothetical protein